MFLREKVAAKMFYCEVQPEVMLIKENDPAYSFFILAKGTMQVLIGDEFRRDLEPGVGFGELALLYDAPRSASIKSLTKCELYGINRDMFKYLVAAMMTVEYSENRKFVEEAEAFNMLNVKQKDSLAGVMLS